MKKQSVWRVVCSLILIAAVACASMLPIAGQGRTEKETSSMMREPTAVTAMSYVPTGLVGYASPFDTDAQPVAEIPEGLMLYPGGMPFGVKFVTEGVTVVGIGEVETAKGRVNPASLAGICERDVILAINGHEITGAAHLTEAIEQSEGRVLVLHCRRGEREFDAHLTPVYCPAESRYKTGIWVRDSGAGIGTVTFIMPETGAFAGLGHGICDASTGALIPMRRGSVSDVTISSVVRGTAGNPGEIKGYFNPGKIGALLGNSTCGVWGVFSEVPELACDPMPIALREEIEEGEATVFCTLDSNKMGRYSVQISNINRDAGGSKCFTVTVTDPALLAASGGIVQGMSGSPIIQNGKIIGAVTHVLINDPARGYGIFVENMLANMPVPARVS